MAPALLWSSISEHRRSGTTHHEVVMSAVRDYDWQFSDASRGYRLMSDEFEVEEPEKVVGIRQELLSALAIAGLVLAAFALV
jgi:hypothetical protein